MSCASTVLLLHAQLSLGVPESDVDLRPQPTARCTYGRLYGDYVDLDGTVLRFKEVRTLLNADADSAPYMVTWREERKRQLIWVAVTPPAMALAGVGWVILAGPVADAQYQHDAAFVNAVMAFNGARQLEALEVELGRLRAGTETPAALLAIAARLRTIRDQGDTDLNADVPVIRAALEMGHSPSELAAAAERSIADGHGDLPLDQMLALGFGLPVRVSVASDWDDDASRGLSPLPGTPDR